MRIYLAVLFLIFLGASSNPKSTWQDGAGPSVPAVQAADKDWTAIFQRSDVIFTGWVEQISSDRAGIGDLSAQSIRIRFRDIQVLKGPDLKEKSFRVIPQLIHAAWPSRQQLIICLKKEADSFVIVDRVEATPENESLIL